MEFLEAKKRCLAARHKALFEPSPSTPWFLSEQKKGKVEEIRGLRGRD